MFNKKILVFPLFGMMVFIGSIAAMLILGRFVQQPEVKQRPAVGLEAANKADKQASNEIAQDSNINKVIEELYYKQALEEGTKMGLGVSSELFNNIEFTNLVAEVNKLKKRYEAKDAEINKREEKLNRLKQDLVAERKRMDLLKKELAEELESIQELKKTIQKDMAVMDDGEIKNMKLLASIYEGMKPKQAASIINKMDTDTAVKLLRLMDQRNSAKILQDIEPLAAVKISERIRESKGN